MRKQYFISGLGANEKAFERLGDFGTKKVMVKWLKNRKEESLINYSQRIIQEYQISKKDIVVGLSFGGLIAQQIADILDIKQVILISSFRTKNDLKPIFKNSLNLKLFKLIPEAKTPFVSNIIADYLNSGSKNSNLVLKEMIKATDVQLMKWSIEKIYEQNDPIGSNIIKYNLLGTKDRIIKFWKNEWTYKVENGSHFMVYDKSGSVSNIINKIIN